MKRFSLRISHSLLFLGVALGDAVAAGLELGAPFSDHAVLQREMKVPVWGWTDAGAEVTVTFGGQSKTATAGADGKWKVELDPLEASFAPREMTITAGADSRTLTNLLVGEVWMASGQSNMQWPVSKTTSSLLTVEPKDGVNPIRECKITDFFASLHPIEHATGEWNDGGYGDYSAIAFAFAHKLYQELEVPIGILNCSFSQTSIEAWTPREGFRDGEGESNRKMYRRVLETDPASKEHAEAWGAYYESVEKVLAENVAAGKQGGEARPVPAGVPGNLNGNRDASWLFNARLNPVIPYAIRGAIWNQGYANIGGGIRYYENLHSLIGGWRERWGRPELPVYFHQFYSAGKVAGNESVPPAVGGAADMRTGTWLARDIPHAGMASQIDVEGAIHYRHKAVPGQRLALHALKNQYGRPVVAEGPMYAGCQVEGKQMRVSFDHAEGGLVVAETGSNALGKPDGGASGFADPKVIENGAGQVDLFHLAGEDRVWHPAKVEIKGGGVVLSAAGVEAPRGVSYGTGGIGFRPNLYNKALLPMSPFMVYDGVIVTAENWPHDPMKIAGVELDPAGGGLLYEYRKMPLLAVQFRDHAVLQADAPVTIWGSAVHEFGHEAEGEAVVHFRLADIEKTIPVTPGMKEWRVTLPPMKASAEPQTLSVRFTIDGELAHERVAEGIVFGDVWYVAGALEQGQAEAADGPVRVMTRKAKRTKFPRPSRYSVCVSTTPGNRFAAEWKNPDGGFAAELGKRLHEKTGRPVGIVLMGGPELELKHWIGFEHLQQAPGLRADYEDLAAVRPGNPFYDANVRRYLDSWKAYWGEYIPEMIATKRVPDGAAWGSYPTLGASMSSDAAEAYNIMVHPFSHSVFKGVVWVAGSPMVESDQGAAFGGQVAALAASWRGTFAGEPRFFYTVPGEALAPKLSRPEGLPKGDAAIGIDGWLVAADRKAGPPTDRFAALADAVAAEAAR